MQVGPAIARAKVTIAGRIGGRQIVPVRCVLDVQFSRGRKKLAIAAVTRRKDAVKLVDAEADGLPKILRRSHAHEVTRLILGEKLGGEGHHVQRRGMGLPQRKSPERIAGKVEIDKLPSAL